MKPNPMSHKPEDDEEFVARLRQLSLRPPPVDWRDRILSAATTTTTAAPAAVPKPWHRSPFWRGMAALWVVSIVLWADTPRLAPATPPVTIVSRDSSDEQMRALLAELEQSPRRPLNIFAPLP